MEIQYLNMYWFFIINNISVLMVPIKSYSVKDLGIVSRWTESLSIRKRVINEFIPKGLMIDIKTNCYFCQSFFFFKKGNKASLQLWWDILWLQKFSSFHWLVHYLFSRIWIPKSIFTICKLKQVSIFHFPLSLNMGILLW